MITASLFISNDISSVVLELFRKARRNQFQSGGQVSQFLTNRIAPSLKFFLRHYTEPKAKQGGGGGDSPFQTIFESKSITNLEARAPPPSYGPAMIQKTTGVQTKSRMCIYNKGGRINVYSRIVLIISYTEHIPVPYIRQFMLTHINTVK